ncbi:type II toxin-antitoxin system PemK/MazF family toxin [Vibrio parahaemolyticus]|uniref:type II toxin-antitoxin system PemK/MazF family toxin n=1 Tax=Vibrio parahaemolyticus TaxID=670 RepID=UPI0004D7B558|nr:type II toxin-antitoxin system PemK/MazF family toxin [Vibrio parahaemolyticus]EHK2849486.1 type II toxin-antitoxin system PemK/MazF family toxin [Vibrio parahaemolyticus]EIZ1365224.1 type II toxin-antitoxin system PemK/MazF family toxin [Vibrio parahaemolyticus]EKF6650995.1 type II toxin-antitoxin system PemK/MazF family toxin [Vibrio parahaemolyticus]ELA8081713.1 type II toxin-antitoxin system PemK/MazF family toxin [Vibrio parahaemolyticus]ELA8100684.1 type II toxin-antitoxin system PemK
MYNDLEANSNKSSEIRVALTVTYYLFDDTQVEETTEKPAVLGVESYTNINEILLPDSSNANITITCYFDGHTAHRWIVRVVEFKGHDVSVYLSPRDTEGEVFLPQTMKRVHKSAMQLLRFGTIVEVDFGFKPKIYKGTDLQTSAKRYPDVVQHLELYKRRPAIVLKTTRRGVQVVPLTSQEPDDYTTNSSVFKLSEESLKDCTQLGKESYVLSHFIQTVGYSRILPPLSKYSSHQAQRLDTYRVRICRDDEKRLNTALAHNVGLGDYYTIKKSMNDSKQEVEVLTNDKEKLATTVSELESKNDSLKQEFAKIRREHATLRELLKDQYLRAELYTTSEVDEQINNELIEFTEIATS